MMRRGLKGLIATCLVVWSSLTLAVPAAGQSARTDLTSLAACVRERGSLAVLMLFDESGSLQETDPDDQRVVAATALLRKLGTLGSASSDVQPPSVEVSLAGFSAGFVNHRDWTDVTPETLPALESEIERFADRDRGIDTDFALALEGAHQELARHAATSSDAIGLCQTIILFTDGNYDIDPGSTEKPYAPGFDPAESPEEREEIVARGIEYLCRGTSSRTAVVDQIRESEGFLIAVALSGDIDPEDQALIQSMATGSAGATVCGTAPAMGAYLSADENDGLIRLFDEIGSLLNDGTMLPPTTPTFIECELGPPCVRVELPFSVAPSYSKVHILAETGSPEGVAIEVVGPEDAVSPVRVSFPDAQPSSLAGAEVDSTWLSPTAQIIDLELPREAAERWSGDWVIRFWDLDGLHPELRGAAQIFVFGDLMPRITAPAFFDRGVATDVTVAIVDSTGATQFVREPGSSLGLRGRVIEPQTSREYGLTFVVGEDGQFRATFEPPEGVNSTSLEVEVSMLLTVGDLELTPIVVRERVPLRSPPAYPQITPANLDFGSVKDGDEQVREVTALLTVTGGVTEGTGDATGCVWFDQATIDILPDGVTAVGVKVQPDVTGERDCLEVGTGERKEVAFTLTSEGAGAGLLKGSVVAHLSTTAAPGEVIEVRIPLSLRMSLSPDAGVFVAVFAALLAGGLAVPLMLASLWNRRSARFQPASGLRITSLPVEFDGDSLISRSGAPLDLARLAEDPWITDDPSSLRSLHTGDLVFEARTSRWPVLPPFGIVSSGGRPIITRERSGQAGPEGRIPLQLDGVWVFVVTTAWPPTESSESLYVEQPSSLEGVLHLIAEPMGDQREVDDWWQAAADDVTTVLGERFDSIKGMWQGRSEGSDEGRRRLGRKRERVDRGTSPGSDQSLHSDWDEE